MKLIKTTLKLGSAKKKTNKSAKIAIYKILNLQRSKKTKSRLQMTTAIPQIYLRWIMKSRRDLQGKEL